MKDVFLIEVSFEVANMVGGIYSVLASKSIKMMERFPNYLAIGFYDPFKSPNDFISKKAEPEIEYILEDLKKEGIVPYYGLWKGGNCSPCILLETKSCVNNEDIKNDIKRRNWELFGIDSLNSPFTYDEPIVWSEAAGKLIELLIKTDFYKDKKSVVIAHEWLSSGVIFRKKAKKLDYKTIFMAHQTMHGREDSALGMEVASLIDEELRNGKTVSPKRAYEINIAAKHLTERAASRYADLFVTVSYITAKEAEYYLGKAPDMVLPNGIDLKRFDRLEKNLNKNKILRFINAFFYPYYDLENIDLIALTSGRYEFENKGFDLFISSLAKLNEELKTIEEEKIVIAFFLVPAAVKGLNSDVANIIEKYPSEKLRETYKGMTPRLSTHDYLQENDPILNLCWKLGLRNEKTDTVKVIAIPDYIRRDNPPIHLDYFDFVSACDVGVFPSKYEPFGLTPLETAACGCISITTDLAGFGVELLSMEKGKRHDGIYVLPRRNKSFDETSNILKNFLFELATMPEKDKSELKKKSRELASIFSWDRVIENYVKAVERVLEV
ncbi:MAG: glycosyltransferase [Candidatus Hydrothermarchaeota archaeon]